jgi:predicted nucleic acid-binding protein
MRGEAFLDTNVLVYPVALDDPRSARAYDSEPIRFIVRLALTHQLTPLSKNVFRPKIHVMFFQ